jgi:hypothetical protein
MAANIYIAHVLTTAKGGVVTCSVEVEISDAVIHGKEESEALQAALREKLRDYGDRELKSWKRRSKDPHFHGEIPDSVREVVKAVTFIDCDLNDGEFNFWQIPRVGTLHFSKTRAKNFHFQLKTAELANNYDVRPRIEDWIPFRGRKEVVHLPFPFENCTLNGKDIRNSIVNEMPLQGVFTNQFHGYILRQEDLSVWVGWWT